MTWIRFLIIDSILHSRSTLFNSGSDSVMTDFVAESTVFDDIDLENETYYESGFLGRPRFVNVGNRGFRIPLQSIICPRRVDTLSKNRVLIFFGVPLKPNVKSISRLWQPTYIFLVSLGVMPGIDFTNHSCWDFKTLVVEGGMWIECTGTNLPKADQEPYYMVEIKDYKKGFPDTNSDCPSGMDVRSFSSQFKFVRWFTKANKTEHLIGTQNKWEIFNCDEEKLIQFFDGSRIRFRTPFLNACQGCEQLNGTIMSDEMLRDENKKHCSIKADPFKQIQFNLFKSNTNCSGMVIKLW